VLGTQFPAVGTGRKGAGFKLAKQAVNRHVKMTHMEG